ncbi:MAG: tetratricopeptide repeat protein [Anaerolineae bacterium]
MTRFGEPTLDDARDLRQRGIQLAKAGQRDEARQLLQQSIRIDPDNEAAWLWLASVARDNRERLFCLQKLLEINPENETARKALEAATPAAPPPTATQTIKRLPNAPVTQPAPAENLMNQAPGVPVPMPDRIADAQKQAEALVRAYLAPHPSNVKWVHKTHRRAGEGDIIVFRAYVIAGTLVALIVLILAGVVLVQTNDDVREIVLGPSLTPTPSPTITPTNTPGITPTPSATPRLTPTPSASPPPNLAAAKPPSLPRATEIYPEILERSVYEAAQLVEQGNVSVALPTLDKERELTFDTRFDANPYYYQAMALVKQGRLDDALDILDEANDRVEERPDNLKIEPFIDSGYAQVYWAMVEQAASIGNPVGADQALTQVIDHAQAAVDGDRRLAIGYILLAQAYTRQTRYSDALEILNQGLNAPELISNTELIMAKAQVYFAERDFDQALYQIYLAHYIDPSVEAGYQLKIRIAMMRNRPGDAVLASEDYLFYYPGSTTAWRLLGDARTAEHKDDLAIAAYTQGLAGDGTDDDAQAMLESRAELYHSQRRYSLAVADYDRLYEITGDARVHALRMQEAFAAGEFDQALDDANALIGRGAVGDGIVNLVRGGAMIERAEPDDRLTLQQAAAYLTQATSTSEVASSDLRGTAYEYLARAQLFLGDPQAALDAVNLALGVGETGSRHYWRGRILQEQGDQKGAISDYEWVLAWSEIFPYPFRVDAQDQLEALLG